MKKSYLIAIVMSVIIIVWMMSGMLTSSQQDTERTVNKTQPNVLVETQLQNASPVTLSLTVQGQVEPLRSIGIRSDLDGRVAYIGSKEGANVKAGETIFRLDPEDRKIRLAKENALLLSRQQTYQRTQALVKQNLQPQNVLEADFAALKTAEASVAQIELELEKLNITAPFDGTLGQLDIELNSYIKANTELARFVDNSVLSIVIPVAQQDIHKLSVGLDANVTFATGEMRTGYIRFISPVADANTRTFRVELDVPNTDGAIPAGISAEVDIPYKQIDGHFVSPAVLALDAQGQIGVKSVDIDDRVVFNAVTIIKATTEGIWIQGLPSDVNIITVGQGFVEAGAKVDWQLAAKKSDKNSMMPDRSAARVSK